MLYSLAERPRKEADRKGVIRNGEIQKRGLFDVTEYGRTGAGRDPGARRAAFEELSEIWRNRRTQPLRELLRCGIFMPIFSLATTNPFPMYISAALFVPYFSKKA